jgi:cyanate permease
MGTAAGILSPALGGWRGVMVVFGFITLILSFLWMLLYRDRSIAGTSEKREQSIFENFKKIFKIKDVWWASAFMGLNMTGLMAVIALLPNSLAERGMTEARAGALVAIMFGMSSAFKIVGGLLSDRLGSRRPFIFVSSIAQGICVVAFALSTGAPLIIALVIAGIAMGIIPPVFTVIPVEIKEIGPTLAATAMGLIFMIGNSGGLIGPIVAGKLMDLTGAPWPGFLFMGVTIIIAGFCILPVRETGQRRKE